MSGGTAVQPIVMDMIRSRSLFDATSHSPNLRVFLEDISLSVAEEGSCTRWAGLIDKAPTGEACNFVQYVVDPMKS